MSPDLELTVGFGLIALGNSVMCAALVSAPDPPLPPLGIGLVCLANNLLLGLIWADGRVAAWWGGARAGAARAARGAARAGRLAALLAADLARCPEGRAQLGAGVRAALVAALAAAAERRAAAEWAAWVAGGPAPAGDPLVIQYRAGRARRAVRLEDSAAGRRLAAALAGRPLPAPAGDPPPPPVRVTPLGDDPPPPFEVAAPRPADPAGPAGPAGPPCPPRAAELFCQAAWPRWEKAA